MSKKIMTVLGEINPEEMGVTLTHEHAIVDVRSWMHEAPLELTLRELVKQPVTLENRGEVVYRNFYFEDNLLQTDVNVAIDEIRKFKVAGGGTIFDMSCSPNIGRDPEALYKISTYTGVNIVMGSGKYVIASWSKDDLKKTEKQITQDIINDFNIGVSDMNIKSGIIGEVGVSDISNATEQMNLRASAAAQKELKCGMIIHCPIWEKDDNKILDILEKSGADISRVGLSHCDPTLDDVEYHDSLAKRGAYIEYDQFGMELMTYEGKFLPSDGQRIEAVLKQIERGNIDRILFAHDICFKITLTKWGGWGYAHILKHIRPRLLQAGLSNDQINKIMIENPRRLICGL